MIKYESKIIGKNPIWISALLTITFLIVCKMGGNNVHWGFLGFEVIFPFYMSIVIGELVKIRTDPMFDVISAQGKSVFIWILRRYILLFSMVCIFAFIGIYITFFLKKDILIYELILVFLSTSFFLSTICILVSLLSDMEHMGTMIVGIFWLFSLMSISLLRFKPIQLCYIFVRYAGIHSYIWVINKGILVIVSLLLWLIIYVICKRRLFIK